MIIKYKFINIKLLKFFIFISIIFIINGCKLEPEACFEIEKYSYNIGETVVFSSCSENAKFHEWDFGDGNTSEEENPTHQYEEIGNYTITLTVFKKDKKSESSQTISINPTACFSTLKDIYTVNEVINFENCSEGAESYSWDFDDGEFSSEENPSHSYTDAKDYTVKLIITVNEFEEYGISKTITIRERIQPTSCFTTVSNTYYTNEDIEFLNCSQNSTYYQWNFGDSYTSYFINPIHSYNTSGTYDITLKSIGDGLEHEITKQLTIEAISPISCFSIQDNTHYLDESVNFSNCSQYAESYEWDFGDGTTSTEEEPLHSYSETGTYTVKLKCFGAGFEDETTETVIIELRPPDACFSTEYDTYSIEEEVHFENCSEYADFFEWDFDDGNTSSSENPSHSYSTTGDYTVTLTTSANGMEAVASKTITIDVVLPEACFSTEYDIYIVGENVNFENCSSDADSYEWNFGDGTSHSSQENPTHSYSSEGNYIVELTASAYGYDDDLSKIIKIIYEPVACFGTEYDNYYVGETVYFENCSENADSFHWNFGDGSTSTSTTPTHQYGSTGSYTITLTAISEGFTDIATLNIIVSNEKKLKR